MNTNTTQDILITGLPRSGTTLTCHLLNKVPNSVALHEPMVPNELITLEKAALLERIAQFFAAQRDQILIKGTATSKAFNGAVPTNPRGDADAQGRRTSLLNGKEIVVSNVSRDDFQLCIKHPAFFTAALPVLTGRFTCFAIVRNPLAVLLSWRTAGMAVSDGRMPAAEQFDPRLASLLAAEPDVLNRQLILLDYCFSQYRRFLLSQTIRYEDIIRSGGKALSLINPAANQLNEPLGSRNMCGIQTDSAAKEIGMRLLGTESSCWSFYEKVDVEALLLSQ